MSTIDDRERERAQTKAAKQALIEQATTLKGEGKSNAEIAEALNISENSVRILVEGPDNSINWGFNCLTAGIHHGRPEAIWNIGLLHATNIMQVNHIEELVITRIYSDAMQIVEHNVKFDEAWAERVKEIAQGMFQDVLKHKVSELEHYYDSPSFQSDLEDAIRRFAEGKLNPHYGPLHSHDTINMLCRIIGVSASQKASS